MSNIGSRLIPNGESIEIAKEFNKLQMKTKLNVLESFYRTLNNCFFLFNETDDVVRHMGTPSSICLLKQKISAKNTNPGLQQIIPSMEIWSKESYVQNFIFFIYYKTNLEFGYKLAREISHIGCKRFIVTNKQAEEQGGACFDSCLIKQGTTKEKFSADCTSAIIMLKSQESRDIGAELLDELSTMSLEPTTPPAPSPINPSTSRQQNPNAVSRENAQGPSRKSKTPQSKRPPWR